MKFGHKLFFAIITLLTVSFTIISSWMLFSYFQSTINREIEKMNYKSQMFHRLFESAYEPAEYLKNYAIVSAIEQTVEMVEEDKVKAFVTGSQGNIYYGKDVLSRKSTNAIIQKLIEGLTENHMYTYGIRKAEGRQYLFFVSRLDSGEQSIYLGIYEDITTLYMDRDSLVNQYRIALVILLLVGGSSAFLLSRYMTRPIRDLEKVAGEIASGDYEKRVCYSPQDEIGALSQSFNEMADALVNHLQLKELEAKQKEDFTAAFAHELKTPLTSIIGYADMLNSIHMSEEEQREAFYYIYSQGKRLENLSHKLLELAGMENTPLLKKPIKTKEMEENIRATMRPVFEAKKIHGKILLDRAVLSGDKDLLLSLLYNLLDNAVKAVENNGYILLKGTVVEEGYEFKVVDNGRGIPKEEIARITEAFYMVDKSRSRKEGGAGIGMALCQKIVALHNGVLLIDSKEAVGTIVKVLLPKEANV